MLIGRESERASIAQLVAAARIGHGGVLVVSGEAGIGKTALLQAAAELTGSMCVLRATGSEAERELPFGGLHQLLRPALAHLGRIPGPQADALATALALRAAVGPNDRFAVGAATLSLLSRFAEDQAVAVLLDDAQLLDRPSAEALVFAARRLAADPIAVLAAVRDGHESAFLDADLPRLRLTGLDPDTAARLVRARPAGAALLSASPSATASGTASGEAPEDDVAVRLYRATGGNPLALIELSADPDALRLVPPGAPLPVSAALADVFSRRAGPLPADTRTALLVAAAAGEDLAVVARACELLGVQVSSLQEAERVDLITLSGDRVRFRHPLVRAALFGAADPAQRRAAHRAVAAALGEHETDRRAWHLSEAALGPDPEAAAALVVVASRARDRGAHAVAATALERAAGLTAEPESRAERLVDAGEAAWLAGQGDRAESLLLGAVQLAPRPALTARAQGLSGAIAARRGSLRDARDLLLEAARPASGNDPDTVVPLLVDVVHACFYLGDGTAALSASTLIEDLLARCRTDRARVLGTMAVGMALILAGRNGARQIREAVRQMSLSGDVRDDPLRSAWLVLGPLWLREEGTGRDLVQRAVDDLRTRAAVGTLPQLLLYLARDDAASDRWDVAEAEYTEAIRLARETGQTTELAVSLAGQAWLLARQGRAEECRQHAGEALAICEPRQLQLGRIWAWFALGELDLALGRVSAALDTFRRLAVLLEEIGVLDADLFPEPELVEALLRLGREAEAREVADRYRRRAEAKGQPWALARAARAIGQTGPDSALEEWFGQALVLHGRTPDLFERARTELAYGGRLRRARRRVDARPPLRSAVATFDRLGAGPWAELAATELRATGETAHRQGEVASRHLTPQELQISLLLVEGRTTREAAAALFLSPKTVEYHLRHVYSKLGVGSREELAGVLGTP